MDKRKKMSMVTRKEEFWTRKDKQKVTVESMNEYHEKNALRKMLRENRTLRSKLKQTQKNNKEIISFIRDIGKEFTRIINNG